MDLDFCYKVCLSSFLLTSDRSNNTLDNVLASRSRHYYRLFLPLHRVHLCVMYKMGIGSW